MLRKIIREEARRIVENEDNWVGPDMKTLTSSPWEAHLNTQRAGIGTELGRVGRIPSMSTKRSELKRMIDISKEMGNWEAAEAYQTALDILDGV
jgi:glutamine synthetase